MKVILKSFVCLILVVLAFASIYLGSFLPLEKAQRYIRALNATPAIHSLQEFEANYNNVFNFYSPIGAEETVKFFSNDLVTIIAQPDQPESVVRALVAYWEPLLFQNNVRHLLMGGEAYSILWAGYGHKAEDAKKAEDYYLKAYAIGPKLPPVLYGLLGLYQMTGDTEKYREIANQILTYWPNLDALRATLSPATSSPAK